MAELPFQNLVLIGMRGAGKSTLGSFLARLSNFQFIDLDEIFAQRQGQAIPSFVAKFGWAKFRALESELIAEFAQKTGQVIATGGGVVLDSNNIAKLKKTGLVILLKVPLVLLQKRVARDANRPSLTGGDPAVELGQVWRARKKLYLAAADLQVDCATEAKDLTCKAQVIWQQIQDFSKRGKISKNSRQAG